MSSNEDDEYTAQDAVDDGQEGVAEDGVSGYAKQSVIGGTLSALSVALSATILTARETLFEPIRAFTSGMATFIGGTIGAPVEITDAGATASADSFTEGAAAFLGPFAFPVAVGVSVLGMLIFLWFLTNSPISPLSVIRDRGE